MPHLVSGRTGELTTTTGTGAYTTSGIIADHATIASRLSVDDYFYGFVEAIDALGNPTGEWEEGRYTCTALNTYARTEVFQSSNDDLPVNWGAGTKRIKVSFTAALARTLIAGSVAKNKPTGGGGGGGALTYTAVPAGIVSGATVTLNRDTVYMGTLNLAGLSNVTVLAGGSGALPVVSPGKLVPSVDWTLHSGNIYKATFPDFTPTALIVDGAPAHTAHYPNRATRWLRCRDEASAANQLHYTLPVGADVVGAKAFVQVHNSAAHEFTITAYDSGSGIITLDGNPEQGTRNKRFYLEGKLWALQENNSFVYEAGVLYLWCADGLSPSAKTVWATPASNCIDTSNSTNISVNNVETWGGLGNNSASSTGVIYRNCVFRNATHNALYLAGSISPTVDGCTATNSHRDAINLWYGTHNVTVTNNHISNTGLVGMPKLSHGGIHSGSESNENLPAYTNNINNNEVWNSAYHGIQITRNHNTNCNDNIVDGACLAFTDGGGIYTGQPIRAFNLNMQILRNTVRNVYGEGEDGLPHGGAGIYLDDSAAGVTIQYNNVSACNMPLFLHNAYDNNIRYNTFSANNALCTQLVKVSSDDSSGVGSANAMFNNIFKNNTLTSTKLEPQTFNMEAGLNMPNWLTVNENTYNLPRGADTATALDNCFARTWDGIGDGLNRSYNNWKAMMGSDTLSVYNVIAAE